MSNVPDAVKLYHITHVENLPQIIADGCLWSDAERRKRTLLHTEVGMSSIKRRRLEELTVDCHPGTKVGQYVPFYFCPRSIMLYLLFAANHPELEYRGGQEPLVHLQADLQAVVQWADAHNVKWAFSDCNAGAAYAQFYSDLDQLPELNWRSIAATDFRDPRIKNSKQAEFLVYHSFPWTLVEHIGVCDQDRLDRVSRHLRSTKHKPLAKIARNWYY